MIAAFDRGDHTKAWELNALLLESWEFESSELTPNPIPAKAMMRAIGRPAGQCRLPMGPAPAGLEQRALEVWNTLHG
jgi:4-hydroxy-tetrahydrodipicolinate synthase